MPAASSAAQKSASSAECSLPNEYVSRPAVTVDAPRLEIDDSDDSGSAAQPPAETSEAGGGQQRR